MSGRKRTLLFVDDEPQVLAGLRRMLHSLRGEWELHFAGSGQEALALAEKLPLDVIVSDMRMPGMDGVMLLSTVRERWPRVIRIVLSGHTDRAIALGSARVAHQFLAKPCSAERLRATIERTEALRDLLENDELRQFITGLERLPSMPSLYLELVAELESSGGSVKRAGEIIARDIGMSAKVLQFVNSAFLGVPHNVTNPAQAAVMLGMTLLKALVLGFQVFSVERNPSKAAEIEKIWAHSLAVSSLARRIAGAEQADAREAEDAVVGGLLHEVGRLVLLEQPEDVARANERLVPLLGAYLLGLWGLPTPVVEVVAYYRQPSSRPGPRSVATWAVHAANAVVLHHPELDPVRLGLDAGYAGPGDLALRLRRWGEAYQKLLAT